MMKVCLDLSRLLLVEHMLYGHGVASPTRRVGNNIANTCTMRWISLYNVTCSRQVQKDGTTDPFDL